VLVRFEILVKYIVYHNVEVLTEKGQLEQLPFFY